MKRPEERLTPGRKALYKDARNVTLYVPQVLLKRAAAAKLPDVKSQNQKLVMLLEIALDHLDEFGGSDLTDSDPS